MKKKGENCRLLSFSSSSFPLVDTTSFKNDLPPPPLDLAPAPFFVNDDVDDHDESRDHDDAGSLGRERRGTLAAAPPRCPASADAGGDRRPLPSPFLSRVSPEAETSFAVVFDLPERLQTFPRDAPRR